MWFYALQGTELQAKKTCLNDFFYFIQMYVLADCIILLGSISTVQCHSVRAKTSRRRKKWSGTPSGTRRWTKPSSMDSDESRHWTTAVTSSQADKQTNKQFVFHFLNFTKNTFNIETFLVILIIWTRLWAQQKTDSLPLYTGIINYSTWTHWTKIRLE